MTVKNVKLAAATLARAEKIISALASDKAQQHASEAEQFVKQLQSDAYYTRLDGRSARAVTLNRLADKVARARNDLRCAS